MEIYWRQLILVLSVCEKKKRGSVWEEEVVLLRLVVVVLFDAKLTGLNVDVWMCVDRPVCFPRKVKENVSVVSVRYIFHVNDVTMKN